MKRLLRDKSNYVVLEGFLSTLLEEDLRISRFLESESNQIDETDKFNRADILVEDSKGRLLVIKIQNYRELYYYHQMLYGASLLTSYRDTLMRKQTITRYAKSIPSILFISA